MSVESVFSRRTRGNGERENKDEGQSIDLGPENEKKRASTRDNMMGQQGTERKEEGDGRALNTGPTPRQGGQWK